LLERDEVDSFRKAIEKRCIYYYDLLPVLEDRSSARPVFNSDNFNGNGDDDKYSETQDVRPFHGHSYYDEPDTPSDEEECITGNNEEEYNREESEESDPTNMIPSSTTNKEIVAPDTTTNKVTVPPATSTKPKSRPITASSGRAPSNCNNKKVKVQSIDDVMTNYALMKEEEVQKNGRRINAPSSCYGANSSKYSNHRKGKN
jgi:hypothetical protein